MAKKPAKKVARKRAAPKPAAKAGKKPARGVAKKAPVRVKKAKPKARALHVPGGDMGHAYMYEEGHLDEAVALAELAAASSAAVDFGVSEAKLRQPEEEARNRERTAHLDRLRRDAHATFRRQRDETFDAMSFAALQDHHAAMTKTSRFHRYRSAITGLFVSACHALRHPRTTYRDAMQRRAARKG